MPDLLKLISVWTIEDIGPVVGLLDPGTSLESRISAVNDAGVVVGSAMVGPRWHAFTIQGTTVTDVHPAGTGHTFARDINRDGWIVGAIVTLAGVHRGFVRSPAGVMSQLGQLPGADLSNAESISNTGQVVGDQYAAPLSSAISWGPPLPGVGAIPALLHSSNIVAAEATVVNSSGRVGGVARETAGGPQVPAYFEAGQWTTVGFMSAGWSRVLDMNESGTMVGWGGASAVYPQGAVGPFVIEGGVLTFLPDLWPAMKPRIARGISDAGDIVGDGMAWMAPNLGVDAPFFYSKNSGLIRLDSLLPPNTGWELTSAAAISPSGRVIVGQGRLDGERRVFRMTLDVLRLPAMRIPEIPRAWRYIVLGDAHVDGPGAILGPKGPVPIEPWGGHTAGMPEVLRALALHELSAQLADPTLRRSLQPQLLRHAADLLMEMSEIAGQASTPAKIGVQRKPSKLRTGPSRSQGKGRGK